MSPRIVLVEDNAVDADLISSSLQRAIPDLEMRRVDTEDAFRTALDEFNPDLIVSDHQLPQFSGRQALALTREQRPRCPFLLVTGSLDEETAVEYMKGGATDYILKDRTGRLGAAVLGALQQAQQRKAFDLQQMMLQKVLDTDPSLIFVKDFDGRFVLVNQAVADIYHCPVRTLVGKTDADFSQNPEEVERFLRDDQEVMVSQQPKLIAEEPVTDPSTGLTRWFQTIKVPLTLPGNERQMMLGVGTDITLRRQLEDQLRQSQKMEAVGRLAGGIAHDFNNMLTAIMGYSQILLTELPVENPQRVDLEEIVRSAERAAALTRQLLAFSRRQILQPQNLNLNDLVENLDRFLRRLIGEDIDLKLGLTPALGPVFADAGQIEQVVMNLAVNARDAMPVGGKLTIETANIDLDDIYSQEHLGVAPGPYVMIAVSDTGVGMTDTTKAQIFEPFFTTKPPGKGTGLGLSTVYGIVKQSGGNIWIYSEPGRGTTFKIYLPRAAQTAEQLRTRPAMAAVIGGSETILIAEDENAVRALAAKALRRQGYTVLEAARGAEAMALAEEHSKIDLLLTDVVMPEYSGSELARQLLKLRPAIRVLFMSGYTDEAVIHHGVLTSNFAFLQKPFTPDILARKVRVVLDT
ncbi:MAG: response regulator [Gemmatimonadota bacterium]